MSIDNFKDVLAVFQIPYQLKISAKKSILINIKKF